jgi:micrococcal nuclease
LKRRKKSSITVLLTLLIVIVFVVFPDENKGDFDGPFQVTRVVDGDTIVVQMAGAEKKVRLIGIDTPESVHPDETRNVPYGKIASEFTRQQLEGQQVYLEYDVAETDKYGRILAYVWLNDKMFNKTLLQEGHAMLATFPPNVRYVDDFTKLQAEARDAGKGLWGVD